MPATKVTHYKACNESITKTQGSVKCKACSHWLHGSCANIADKDLVVLKTLKSYSFICTFCEANLSNVTNNGGVVEKINNLNDKLDTFIQNYQSEQNLFKSILEDIKTEMTSCVAELKSSVNDCVKRVNEVESVTLKKIPALEAEDNVLHRRINRCDFLISGLPEGLNDLEAPVIALGAHYKIPIVSQDINTVCYINRRKQILVKLNKMSKRDAIMKEYFRTRTLKVCDIFDCPDGNITSRVYLNDHYSPAASQLNTICRKLRQLKIISKFNILNADKLAARLTLPDGVVVVRDVKECEALLDNTERS